MPVETRMSAEFGELVRKIMDSDSLGKGTMKTGISTAYLMWMQRGKVPSEDIIRKFHEGYSERSDLHALMVTAGYEQSTEAVKAVEFGLRNVTNIPEEGCKQILDFAKMVEEKYAKPHKHNFEEGE
jgi:hypothetical protein